MSAPAPAERTLWTGRPSYWNYWPSLLIGDLLVLLALALWWTGRTKPAPWTLLGSVPMYLDAVVRRLCVRYTVTDQRVTAASGLVSRRLDEVEVGDVRSIVLTQSLFERLVGIGTVGLSTAAGEEIEVFLRGVPDADKVKETVRGARRAASPRPEAPGDADD
ncbi:MAG: PH domain-containing protein [Elusimicrobia bacterium]|nr:PH domain-containing protein [Elusimicrobiota bacterium]